MTEMREGCTRTLNCFKHCSYNSFTVALDTGSLRGTGEAMPEEEFLQGNYIQISIC